MALSNDLISQFVKITKDEQDTKKETVMYGTIQKNNDDDNYVRLDGSDVLTPVSKTVVASEGDRVTVMIKDHTATVTGNISNPSARVIDTVTIENLNASNARIDNIEAANITIQDTLNAHQAFIDNIDANYASIDYLESNYIKADKILTDYLTAEQINSEFAKIESLDAVKGDIMDSGWINCTLNTGTFTRYSNDIPQPQVRKIGKQVYLRGEATTVTSVTPENDQDTYIATIPSGYRPSERKQFVMQGSSSYRWLMTVHPDGKLSISRYSNGTTTNMSVSSGAWLCCHAQWLID